LNSCETVVTDLTTLLNSTYEQDTNRDIDKISFLCKRLPSMYKFDTRLPDSENKFNHEVSFFSHSFLTFPFSLFSKKIYLPINLKLDK